MLKRLSASPSAALAVTSLLSLVISASGQTTAPSRGSLEGEVAGVKAENAALREQLRNLEEQQKAMLSLMQQLQRRLDGPPVTAAQSAAQPPSTAIVPAAPPTTTQASSALPEVAQQAPVQVAAGQPSEADSASWMGRLGDKYRDGFMVVETTDASKFPFQLRFNDITQFRYTNTTNTNSTFTDHLGVVHDVLHRNDFSINRSMLTFSGFVFSPRLTYGLYVWTTNTTTAVVHGGQIAYRFNKGITLNAGYWGVPGSRTLTYTFPYFVASERSMADNFFRPGFTQGVWATGEPLNGLNYFVQVGNGLNTLAIPTAKIDTHLDYSGSVWWEPLGQYGPTAKARNTYNDFYAHEKPVIRVGTSYTRSRENRFSNLDQSNPENTSMTNSDGVLTFATGAFAPGVTVDELTYRMWAIDGGFKWKGMSLNGQYYFRWLNDFVADRPLPLKSTFDHGFEFSLAHFVVRKRLELFARTSHVFGQFGNSYEYAGGFNWYFVRDHRMWLTGEGMRVFKSPVGGLITPYVGGQTGWFPIAQLMFNF